MEKEKDIKIVAVVGMCGSGKSTAIEYLTERGIPKVYFGGVIYKAMEEAGIARTEDGESGKRGERFCHRDPQRRQCDRNMKTA